MPNSDRPVSPASKVLSFDDPTGELESMLRHYRPKSLTEEVWMTVADDCIALVKRAGRPRRERLLVDMITLATVAAAVQERNRPVTLEEILSDGALLSADVAAQRSGLSDNSRKSMRSVHHRLQAYHRGLPWQVGRARADASTGVVLPGDIRRVADLAAVEGGADAAAFLAAVTAAETARLAGGDPPEIAAGAWRAARRFAAIHDLALTQAALKRAATVELLSRPVPLAVLIGACKLTRRDLDLSVPAAEGLADEPDPTTSRLLRGTSQI